MEYVSLPQMDSVNLPLNMFVTDHWAFQGVLRVLVLLHDGIYCSCLLPSAEQKLVVIVNLVHIYFPACVQPDARFTEAALYFF